MLFRRLREKRDGDVWLIAGLGNPEQKYDNTRHNAGFEVIDRLSKDYDIPMRTQKFRGEYGRGTIEGEKVILLKPLTYMNLSGECIGAFVRFFHIDAATHVIVVCDDVNLDIGALRLRTKGSDGGHNGLKNIIKHLGGQNFPRLRVGVGKKPPKMDLVDFVLQRFSSEESVSMQESYERAAKAVAVSIKQGFDKAMNQFN